MEQIATVKNVNGNIAVVEVSRKAMCDGCHKSECGSGCPMSGLFSSGKSMTASAVNKIGAMPGDTVEITTSDRSILLTAVSVFLLPIVFGGLFYALALYLNFNSVVSAISAVVGFTVPFLFLKLADRKQKNKEPNITIKRILSGKDHSDGNHAD